MNFPKDSGMLPVSCSSLSEGLRGFGVVKFQAGLNRLGH